MEQLKNKNITVESRIKATIVTVWKCWTSPEDIIKWYSASDDWHTPRAENDLTPGGKFNYRMEARDGSFGFDFTGVYDTIINKELIEYSIGDGRKVKINFTDEGQVTKISESFDAENVNSIDQQMEGWKNILNNFKKYVEQYE